MVIVLEQCKDFFCSPGIRQFLILHIATCDFVDIHDRICPSDISSRESDNLQKENFISILSRPQTTEAS